MNPEPKIAIIGCGAMGSAILHGWISSEDRPADMLDGRDFIVVDPGEAKCRSLEDELGVSAFPDISGATRDGNDIPDVVLLAVKPQIIDDVLSDLAGLSWFSMSDSAPLVVSIAAGVPTSRIEAVLGDGVHVVRVMPNLPLQVSLGASVVAKGANATDEEADFIRDLFAALGFASLVDESQIDAACAISGGGPAYVAKMIEDLSAAGVRSGLSKELAEQLAITTVGGSYKLLDEAGIAPSVLRERVCSPGGTTLAALAAMDETGFSRSISDGVSAAINRAKELAR